VQRRIEYHHMLPNRIPAHVRRHDRECRQIESRVNTEMITLYHTRQSEVSLASKGGKPQPLYTRARSPEQRRFAALKLYRTRSWMM